MRRCLHNEIMSKELIYYCTPQQAYETWCPAPIKKIFNNDRIFCILNEANEIWLIYLNDDNIWEVREMV